MKSAFAHFDLRCKIIYERIKSGFRDLRQEYDLPKRVRRGDSAQ